jgi:hypothetical protein
MDGVRRERLREPERGTAMNAFIVLPALAGIAVVFVLAPVAVAVWSYYRRPKVVRCPAVAREALVRVNAVRAAADAMTGRPGLSIASCSLWPRRRECAQACTARPMRAVTVRA